MSARLSISATDRQEALRELLQHRFDGSMISALEMGSRAEAIIERKRQVLFSDRIGSGWGLTASMALQMEAATPARSTPVPSAYVKGDYASQYLLNFEERERKAATARRRFEELSRQVASEQRLGGPEVSSTEVEIMEEATLLVKQSQQRE